MAAYADYTYYSGTFGGAAIPSADFPRYALRASREVDKITLYRIQSDDNPDGYQVDDKVRNAVCAVADVLYKQDQSDAQTGGGLIKSESVDSHSIAFNTLSPDAAAKYWQSQKYFAAHDYLTGTGLTARGVGKTCGN